MSTALESQLDDLIKLTTERMAEHQQMLAAIRAWHEWWNDSYDGEPLRDHEVKMLAVLAKFVDDMEVPHA